MSSHPRMQRLGERLSCSSSRSDRGQGWKIGCPPILAGCLVFLTMAILESQPCPPAFLWGGAQGTNSV